MIMKGFFFLLYSKIKVMFSLSPSIHLPFLKLLNTSVKPDHRGGVLKTWVGANCVTVLTWREKKALSWINVVIGARIRVQTLPTWQPASQRAPKWGWAGKTPRSGRMVEHNPLAASAHDSGSNSLLGLVVLLVQLQMMQPQHCWSAFHVGIVNANTTEPCSPEPRSCFLSVFSPI